MRKLMAVALIVSMALTLSGCVGGGQEKDVTTTSPPDQSEGVQGLALSPMNYQDGFVDFFQKAALSGGYVSWAGDWNVLKDDDSAPYVVIALSETYGITPVILVSTPFDSGGTISAGELDEYSNTIAEFVRGGTVPYISIGVEMNSLYERDTQMYSEYVDLFNTTAQMIREVSPGSLVMATFQLESMKGLQGGLFGEDSGDGNTQWTLLDDFEEADILAFTTYPCLVEKDPSDLPDDYYSEILSHTQKDVAIVESGWFRNGPAGWESSSQEQAEFVEFLTNHTDELSPRFIIWSFLYDQDVQYPFDSMGLLAADEESSPAWEAWKGSV
ncbi:MAG TPA: hypothetical protein PK718_00790 [Candidatus Methanofastidiosa archaeon]|nr:hypothetical protein [Candidatus Methanofastidiosa archaeon]